MENSTEAQHWFDLSYRMGAEAFDDGESLGINVSEAYRRGFLDAEKAARFVWTP